MSNPPGTTRKRKPLPPIPKKRNSKNFTGDLESIRENLNLNKEEFKALRRALRDAETKKPKTKVQHQEDEDWLDWAVSKAKRYGPQLLELLELA